MAHWNRIEIPTDAAGFIARRNELLAIDGDEPVEIDDQGNTEPASYVAAQLLQHLHEKCGAIAWQPAARAELRAAGVLR